MTSKFEQLIEFVINDEEQKAKELFHDIVVEKSREIYETLMDEAEEELDENAEEESDEEEAEELDEMIDEVDLGQQVEAEEAGISEEDDETAEFDDKAEEAGHDLTHDMEQGGEGDIEDRVVDLEDKLDELMAEFESLMGDEGGSEMEPNDDEVGGDAYMNDDTSEFHDESQPMSENIALDATPKPVTTEPSFVNKKSTTAFNSGAAGMAARPVKNTAAEANPDGTSAYKQPHNEYSKGEGNLPNAGKFKNVPAKDGWGAKMEPTPKPVTSQSAGVNTKTPFPKA